MTWQLRRAAPEDLEAIMAIENGVFATDAWSSSAMLDELESANGYYVVAFRPESPGQIEAYAGLRAANGASEGDIQTIAVAPSARRHGLGRTLILTLVTEARKRGALEVFLEVRADNPGAQELYRTIGFEQIGLRPRYYQPDGVDALVMRLEIKEPRLSSAVGA